VQPIYLLDLASQQERWLTVRQAVVAQNIANANTPGYTAMDVGGFQDVFDGAQSSWRLRIPRISASIFGSGSAASKEAALGRFRIRQFRQSRAGNAQGRTGSTAISLNTSVVKAFNQMLSASVKS